MGGFVSAASRFAGLVVVAICVLIAGCGDSGSEGTSSTTSPTTTMLQAPPTTDEAPPTTDEAPPTTDEPPSTTGDATPKPQEVSFSPLEDQRFDQGPQVFTVSVEMGLAPELATNEQCAIEGNNIRPVKVGECVITATNSGSSEWEPLSAETGFQISKGNQTVNFDALASKRMDQTGFTVPATTTAGLTPVYATTTDICDITGTEVTLNSVGACTISATQHGTANWNPAQATRTFQITRGVDIIEWDIQPRIFRTYHPSFEVPFDARAIRSNLAPQYAEELDVLDGCTPTSGGILVNYSVQPTDPCSYRVFHAGDANWQPAERVVVMPFTQARYGYDWDGALDDVPLATGQVVVAATVTTDSTVSPLDSSGAYIRFFTSTPAVCTAAQTENLLDGRFRAVITLLTAGTCQVRIEMGFYGPYLVSDGETRGFLVIP